MLSYDEEDEESLLMPLTRMARPTQPNPFDTFGTYGLYQAGSSSAPLGPSLAGEMDSGADDAEVLVPNKMMDTTVLAIEDSHCMQTCRNLHVPSLCKCCGG